MPPLSQSLHLVRPPTERERGAGGNEAMKRTRARDGKMSRGFISGARAWREKSETSVGFDCMYVNACILFFLGRTHALFLFL
jgi:hypothetical protein